ncbi:MAG: type II toxin-antitoxin system RelE/ParE family toxin [Candidatus Doudnabacteria bacterium]|nr:type II toxin-antitoxin system RelE/ParE family toxin [Candidatus Doudnabacteria bacterium]
MEILLWESSSGSSPVAEYLQQLDPKTRAKITRVLDLITDKGLAILGTQFLQKLSGCDLYEVRIKYNKNSHRILGSIINSKLYLVLGFMKKEQKTRRQFIKLAEDRLKTINR